MVAIHPLTTGTATSRMTMNRDSLALLGIVFVFSYHTASEEKAMVHNCRLEVDQPAWSFWRWVFIFPMENPLYMYVQIYIYTLGESWGIYKGYFLLGCFFKHIQASCVVLYGPRLGAEECWVGGDDDQVWVLQFFSSSLRWWLCWLFSWSSEEFPRISGWCFGTWLLFFSWEWKIIPTDFPHIFRRGRSTTNQII